MDRMEGPEVAAEYVVHQAMAQAAAHRDREIAAVVVIIRAVPIMPAAAAAALVELEETAMQVKVATEELG